MKVSILIANYNSGLYFKECYLSIISQIYVDWEVIIVDDKSTDNSVIVISDIIRDDNRFSLITLDENRGVGFVKRRLAELANGDVAAFLDPDDVILPDALSLIVESLQKNNNIIAAFTSYSICDNVLKNCKLVTEHPFGIRSKNSFWQTGIVSVHPLFGFKLAEYKKTEGINASYRIGEDLDLYLKLEEVGEFESLKEPGYLVRRHKSSLTSESKISYPYIWVMRVLYQTGERRLRSNIFSFNEYAKLILERVIYCLKDCKLNNDKQSYEIIRKEFLTNHLHYKMFSTLLFYKYMLRHLKCFIW